MNFEIVFKKIQKNIEPWQKEGTFFENYIYIRVKTIQPTPRITKIKPKVNRLRRKINFVSNEVRKLEIFNPA